MDKKSWKQLDRRREKAGRQLKANYASLVSWLEELRGKGAETLGDLYASCIDTCVDTNRAVAYQSHATKAYGDLHVGMLEIEGHRIEKAPEEFAAYLKEQEELVRDYPSEELIQELEESITEYRRVLEFSGDVLVLAGRVRSNLFVQMADRSVRVVESLGEMFSYSEKKPLKKIATNLLKEGPGMVPVYGPAYSIIKAIAEGWGGQGRVKDADRVIRELEEYRTLVRKFGLQQLLFAVEIEARLEGQECVSDKETIAKAADIHNNRLHEILDGKWRGQFADRVERSLAAY